MDKYHNHIAIIGAGISGLALGCILQEAKIPVVIFEKSNEVSNYGAGISISPNGIKILKNLKIYKESVVQALDEVYDPATGQLKILSEEGETQGEGE